MLCCVFVHRILCIISACMTIAVMSGWSACACCNLRTHAKSREVVSHQDNQQKQHRLALALLDFVCQSRHQGGLVCCVTKGCYFILTKRGIPAH